MLEASVEWGGGRSTVDAKAASEAELIEALGSTHGCIYTPISEAEVTQKPLDRGWIKSVEIYDGDGYVKHLHLIKSKAHK